MREAWEGGRISHGVQGLGTCELLVLATPASAMQLPDMLLTREGSEFKDQFGGAGARP